MEINTYRPPNFDPENDELMQTWLQLRRELNLRITDEDTLDLLHRLVETELALCESEIQAAYKAGLSDGRMAAGQP